MTINEILQQSNLQHNTFYKYTIEECLFECLFDLVSHLLQYVNLKHN